MWAHLEGFFEAWEGSKTWFGRFAGEAFDLPGSSSGWTYHDFRGSRWQNIKNEFNRGYLKNAYR